jgi:membrane-associated phospholipid phosphatase
MKKRPSGDERLHLPDLRRTWVVSGGVGAALWALALALWMQAGLDEWALLLLDPARVSGGPLVRLSQWLSRYGMAAITGLCVAYYLVQSRRPAWSAPKTLYLYVIFSFGFSGVVGDLLKMVFARPRPAWVFGDQILALTDATTHAMPSGHATKAVALALPVLFLVASRPLGQRVWKWFVGLLALGVAVSRIVLGAHYLSDVLAGLGMAFIGLPIGMSLAHRILRKIPVTRLHSAARIWVAILAALSVGLPFF